MIIQLLFICAFAISTTVRPMYVYRKMYATHEAKFLLDGGCAQPAHAKIVWKKRKKKEQTCYTDEATKNIKNISLLLWDTFLRV